MAVCNEHKEIHKLWEKIVGDIERFAQLGNSTQATHAAFALAVTMQQVSRCPAYTSEDQQLAEALIVRAQTALRVFTN